MICKQVSDLVLCWQTSTAQVISAKYSFVPAPLLNLFRLQQDFLQLECLLILEEQNQIAYPGKPAVV